MEFEEAQRVPHRQSRLHIASASAQLPRPVRQNDEGGRNGDRDGALSALPFSQAR